VIPAITISATAKIVALIQHVNGRVQVLAHPRHQLILQVIIYFLVFILLPPSFFCSSLSSFSFDLIQF